jgi:glycosyltransferase involved in cell wall biosynthesis
VYKRQLSYALAAGKAIVSTPYPYAAEMLADGCGILLPASSSATIADALTTLLCDHGLRTTMAEQAYARGRALTWPLVAASYRRLFARSASGKERRAPLGPQPFAGGP